MPTSARLFYHSMVAVLALLVAPAVMALPGLHQKPDATSAPAAGAQTKAPCNEDPHCKVSAPKLLRPLEAKKPKGNTTKFQGKVQVYCWVPVNGIPTHIKVVRSYGEVIDNAAIEAVGEARFHPATRDGKPVVVDIYFDVPFDWQ